MIPNKKGNNMKRRVQVIFVRGEENLLKPRINIILRTNM